MKNTTSLMVGAVFVVAASTMADAGGFDRGGVNLDQLFDPGTGVKTGVTFVSPQRDLKNVTRTANEANPAAPAATSPSVSVEGDYVVPYAGFKMDLTEAIACLGTYSEPFGADADYGTGNAHSATAVEFSVDTRDYGLTCSYKFAAGETPLGEGFVRIIGGASYQTLDGFQSRQRFLDVANLGLATAGGLGNTSGIGFFDVDGDAVGWRAGIAYEIPDIALRAAVIYNSKYDYDLSGVQDNTGFAPLIPGTAIVPVTLQTQIPQSIEIKLQSGINERTLAFLNLKWQDWSQLGIIPIIGGVSPLDGLPTPLSFDPLYQDGFTINAGVGRVISEDVSAIASLGWDRGTSTGFGAQTDTWTLAAGVSYKPTENIDLQFGGLVGLLTSGSSTPAPGGDAANAVSYSFDNDFVGAISFSGKITF